MPQLGAELRESTSRLFPAQFKTLIPTTVIVVVDDVIVASPGGATSLV